MTGEQSGARPVLRLLAVAGLVLAALVVALLVGVPDTDQLREDVDAAGAWGPVLFAALYAALTLAPLPLSVVTIAAGLLFGFVTGTIVVVIGASVGATAAFLLARGLGRSAVERLAGERLTSLDERIGRSGLRGMLLIRLVPVIPFTVLNYSAGLSSVRTRDYVLGTVVGIVPFTMAYVAAGAFGTDVLNPVTIPLIAVTVVVGALVLVLRRRRTVAAS